MPTTFERRCIEELHCGYCKNVETAGTVPTKVF